MSGKESLEMVKKMNLMIRIKERQLESVADSLGLSSSAFDREFVSGGKAGDPIGDGVAILVDMQKEISELKARLCKLKAEIIKVVDYIPELDDQLLLTEYYLNLKTVGDVAQSMSLSEKTVKARIDEAVKSYEENYLKAGAGKTVDEIMPAVMRT